MRAAILMALAFLLFCGGAPAQQVSPHPDKPSLGVILCWEDMAAAPLAHDPVLLKAIGRALTLDGVDTSIGVHSEACSDRMPDAVCFGEPGGVMCRLSGVERILRVSAWVTARYISQGPIEYENFWRKDPEYIGHAFRYADGVETDSKADAIRAAVNNETEKSRPFFEALVDYNFAALLGHETAHAHDDVCPVQNKSAGEQTGLFALILANDQSGKLFRKHSPAPEEAGGDRCGMRHIKLLNEKLESKSAIQYPTRLVSLRRVASDLVVFQASFGWRKYKQLPDGKYAFFSLDSYLYSPFRAILFSREIAGNSIKPPICGSSAALIVQSIQTNFKKYEGNGIIDDDTLALFPKGVETSWNGAPWTNDSFTCTPVQPALH
jgi:hypothetical protein